jgi:hypothetical protein
VKRLLRADNEAVSVKWEVITEQELNANKVPIVLSCPVQWLGLKFVASLYLDYGALCPRPFKYIRYLINFSQLMGQSGQIRSA